ncbi:hypothetical protein BU16DRAFT_527232 [Lophium mytilinum]|uniref:Uncharacterized protein n=1 Tax=Lophium mytilinum TaxID=390894 RepID=A0A6A6QT60_9PEZI|nr:hypothetical protein BU16DRAFT_527232 [Lophium mytilinum]
MVVSSLVAAVTSHTGAASTPHWQSGGDGLHASGIAGPNASASSGLTSHRITQRSTAPSKAKRNLPQPAARCHKRPATARPGCTLRERHHGSHSSQRAFAEALHTPAPHPVLHRRRLPLEGLKYATVTM